MIYTSTDIKNEFQSLLKQKRFVKDKTGVKTIEIINASFIADNPVIFGSVNEDYVKRELDWYKSQSLNVNDIPGGAPQVWKDVSSNNGLINSNYGWCIYSEENGNQYNNAKTELFINICSRRAVMIYNRPSMHDDYNVDGMSDFMCTNAVQYLIRDGKLHALVYMRSNDAVFGYKNDYAWQKHVLQQLVSDLNDNWIHVEEGSIYWNVASMHVYERHFHLIDYNYAK
jgi:thymidylate synthase